MKKIAKVAVAVLIFLAVSMTGYGYSMLPDFMVELKNKIVTQADESLNGALNFDEVRLSGFMQLSFSNVLLTDESGNSVFSSPEVVVTIDVLGLAMHTNEPMKAISKVDIVKNSKLFLIADDKKQWNISKLIKPSDEKSSFYANVFLQELDLIVEDSGERWEISINGNINALNNPDYKFDLAVKNVSNEAKAVGEFTSSGDLKVKITSDAIEIDPYAKLLERLSGIESLSGIINNINLLWEIKGDKNVFNGGMKFSNVKGSYLKDDMNIQGLFDGGLTFENNKINFSDFNARLNNQQLDIVGGLLLQENYLLLDNLSIKTKAFNPVMVYSSSPWKGDIAGSLFFDGILDEDFKSILVSGELECLDGEVEGVSLKHGKLDFLYRDSRLLLREVKANVLGGQVEISGEYNHALKDIVGTASARDVDLSQLPEAEGFAGKINGDIAVIGKATIDDLEITADVYSEYLQIKGVSLSDLGVRVVRNSGKTELQYANAKIGSGSIIAHGIVEGAPLTVSIQAGNIPLSEVLPAVGLDGYGLLNVDADLFGSWDNLNGSVSIEALDAVVEQQPLRLLRGELILNDGVLVFDKFLAQMNYGIHFVQGYIDLLAKEQAIDLQVISKNVRLEPIAALALPGQSITGNMDNVLKITGTIKNPFLKGDILVTEGSYDGQFVEQARGQYQYSNDLLVLDNFSVIIMQTKILLDGHIDTNGDMLFDFKGENVRVEDFPQLEEVKASGGVDLYGSLTGNIKEPFFTGTIKSNDITVNGQVLSSVDGEVWSKGGLDNYMRISFANGNGTYNLDAGLDMQEKMLYGLLEVKNGDVKSLLDVAGYDLALGGTLDGTIDLNRGKKRTGMLLNAQINNGNIGKVPIEKIDLILHSYQGKITIQKLEAQQGTGKIVGSGVADLRGDLNLEIGGQGLDASLLTALMDNPIAVTGNMGILMQVSGTAKNPEVNASLQVQPGSVENVSFDELYGLFSVKDDLFNIDQLFVSKDDNKISAYGIVPVDLFRKVENRKNQNAQMDILIKLENADLSIIPSVFNSQVEWGMGATSGNLNIKGTLEKPKLYGKVEIEEGILKFKQLKNPLEKINLNVAFDDDKVLLNQLSASMGSGTLNAQGSLDITNVASANNFISIKADKLAIASEIATGELTTDLVISSKEVRGDLVPQVKGSVLIDNFLINLPVVPEFGDSSYNVALDVVFETGKNVRLYNKYLYDMLLDGNLKIEGSTVFPIVSGGVSVKKGTIKYLGTPFKISMGKVGFPVPGTFVPTVSLNADSRISSVYVNINISGQLTEMDVKLSSDPPMSQQQIFRLMTLKTLTTNDNVSGMSEDDMLGLLTVGLQMTFFGNIEDFFRNTGTLDEFRIYQGDIGNGSNVFINPKSISKNKDNSKYYQEQYNLYAGKYLSKNLLLGYNTSLDGDDRIVSLQYEAGKKLRFSASIDENNEMFYGVEYRISF